MTQPLASAHVPSDRAGKRRLPRIAAAAFLALFALKVCAYLAPHAVRPLTLQRVAARLENDVQAKIRNTPWLHHCGPAQRKVVVDGGWLCAEGAAPRDAYDRIFETYPADASGREYVYKSTVAGTVAAGKALLAGSFSVPRYAPLRIDGLPTWSEDPHHSVYWRLNFYALRPTESLLTAYRATGDPRYARRLVAIDESFFRAEASSPWAWKDDHAVSFRAMVLANEWWVLRYYHQLTESESRDFLREIEKTAAFLADVNHYQPQHNHGINEAAALFELGVDFPDLPNAHAWETIARERLAYGINHLVDADGALIENSPYYDFYVLDKYWQIGVFAHHAHISIVPDLDARLRQMIDYATYLLQPDSSVPLLGASLATVVHDSGSFRQMARTSSAFRYVLTHGSEGNRPSKTSVFFPATGQAIFRSGWGRGSSFESQSYLTFNVGPYRTAHSNLDALAITLYGGGIPLLPGTGLYTYAPGAMRDYFHGTASHDTVTVDGKDQSQGSSVAGVFSQAHGVTYQTGESSLYVGVTHRRMVMMVDKAHFLVVDRLSSDRTHAYDQMFHLFPGARVSTSGSTVVARGATPAQTLTISQLAPGQAAPTLTTGSLHPAAGLCSRQYQRLLPCTAVDYPQRGADATFVTLLTVGEPTTRFSARYAAPDLLQIRDGSRSISVRLGQTTEVHEHASATDPAPPVPAETAVPGTELGAWTLAGDATSDVVPASAVASFSSDGTSESTETAAGVDADFTGRNLLVRLRVDAVEDLSTLEVQVSNDDWAVTSRLDIRDAYRARFDGEWVTLSLGRGGSASEQKDAWVTEGASAFDWSRVDGIRILAERSDDALVPVQVDIGAILSAPAQAHAAVAFVFDDGYSSILPAASYLHAKGMPATVAVIGKYVELPSFGHLNVDQLHMLQDDWGWNMVNHTQSHVDALSAYRTPLRLGAYEQDVLRGALFLQQARLDSAPDWFVYPHGTTDQVLERVVRRFYKFARTTDAGPEAFPYGDPLRVKTLEVHNPGDSEGGASQEFTTPDRVQRAVLNAKRYHLTLILTFHRIHSRPDDPAGYPFRDFERIVDGVAAAGVQVTTLSGLDRLAGVPEDNRVVVRPAQPSQLTVDVHTTGPRPGLLTRIWHLVA